MRLRLPRIRCHSSEAGASVVEFALIATTFLLLVSVVVQGAFVFSAWLILTNATREGARFGAPCLTRDVDADAGCTTSDVENVVLQMAQGVDRSQVDISVEIINRGEVVGFQPKGKSNEAVRLETPYVVVSATYPVPIMAPFVELVMPPSGILVGAESEMRLEEWESGG